MRSSYHLITTADERSWKYDQPVLFLGEWCKRYNRKHIWDEMSSQVAEPYGIDIDEFKRNISYIESLSNELLQELSEALNLYHHSFHSERYWDIVLGHWLQRYVAVIFNRYFTLEKALKNYDISETTVFDSSEYSLATTNSINFIWACNDDIWNHVLYSKILDYLEFTDTNLVSEPLKDIKYFVPEDNVSIIRKKSTKTLFFNKLNNWLQKLCKEDDAFIINSYLSLKAELLLQLSLGQCPQLWRSPTIKTVEPDLVKREFLGLNYKNHQGFEKFIRLLLKEIIPTCYLEGYKSLTQQVSTLPWPDKPKFIFTSNSFDTDEVFKAWTALKVEDGVPYFVGQHGNNYGSHIYHGNLFWPERKAADHFFTWGWSNGDPKNIPAFIFTIANRKSRSKIPDRGILLIELHPPHRIAAEDSEFKFGLYQEQQFRFVDSLSERIRRELTVRLHRGNRRFSWSDEQRWKDHRSNIVLDKGVESIHELTAKSRLVVHSYDSTGILETLAQNIPTICFWPGGFDHLLSEAKPYYELLRVEGIIASSPEDAAGFINSHWDNINEWWESEEVQNARKKFCEHYAKQETRPVRVLKKLLTLNINKRK